MIFNFLLVLLVGFFPQIPFFGISSGVFVFALLSIYLIPLHFKYLLDNSCLIVFLLLFFFIDFIGSHLIFRNFNSV